MKDTQSLIQEAAEKRFQPQELKVFSKLPVEQRNTTIHESFVPTAAPPKVPASLDEWMIMRETWRKALLEKSFRAWPKPGELLQIEPVYCLEKNEICLEAHDFTSQGPIRLRLYLVHRKNQEKHRRLVLRVADQQDWRELMAAFPLAAEKELKGEIFLEDPRARTRLLDQLQNGSLVAFLTPRGVGRTLWDQDPKKQTQIRRRFLLLGQTLEGMQTWDVRRALETLRSLEIARGVPLTICGRDVMGGIALYASLFEPGIAELVLEELPATHRHGPIFLNVSRFLEMPQAVAMAAERLPVRLLKTSSSAWEYPLAVARKLAWKEHQLKIVQEVKSARTG
jgi:hypothetical protein